MSYQFYIPTRTLFGIGKLNELHAQEMPGKKAMIVRRGLRLEWQRKSMTRR